MRKPRCCSTWAFSVCPWEAIRFAMTTIPRMHPGINPGCDRCTSIRTRPIEPKLEGPDRRAWEESIFINADLKRSRLHLVRVLLDEFCWGKCYCYPGDALLARKCGLGTAT